MQAHLTVNGAAAIVSEPCRIKSEDGAVQENVGPPQRFLNVLFKLDLLAMSTSGARMSSHLRGRRGGLRSEGCASCDALAGKDLEPVKGA
jgi:hypothetical protein